MEGRQNNKSCKKGREVNVGPEIKQTSSIKPYISTYTTIESNKKELYLCRVIWKWFV